MTTNSVGRLSEHATRTTFLQGARLGKISAFRGSAAFAIAELVGVNVNTYLIKRLDAPVNATIIVFEIILAFLGFLFAATLAAPPAYWLGGAFANWLERRLRNQGISSTTAWLYGAMLGATCALLISTPILLFQYNFVQSTGHGSYVVFEYRALVAGIIAIVCGGWASSKLARELAASPAA